MSQSRDPTEPRPFDTLARRVLVDHRWHRYCEDRYRRTDGSEGSYYYVDMPASVGIIPLFDDRTTILLRQYRYLLGVELWEFPIGGVDGDPARGGEPLLLETGRRELREEAGVEAKRWDHLGCFSPYKGVSNERCHFYLARDLEVVGQELEPEESITPHRMSLAEARERLLQQTLPDGQSLCGLLLLDRFLDR